MAVRYTRHFKYRDHGSDVEGVGRALARAKIPGFSWASWIITPRRYRQKWGIRKQKALKKFKLKHGLKGDYIYGKTVHQKLSPHFDAKARELMDHWHPPLSDADRRWAKLLAAMKELHDHSKGYDYGAGHQTPLDSQSPDDFYDCSSSSSKVLRMASMFPFEYALVSGDFGRWGAPGKGTYFTVYYRSTHVWIRTYKGIWWRFDTSPHGDPKSPRSGPRLRFTPRFTLGFNTRHWPGM